MEKPLEQTKTATNCDTNKTNEDVVNNQTLDLKFIGFSKNDLHIHEAGKYNIILEKKISKSAFYQILSGLYVKKNIENLDVDILLNGISIKNDSIVAKFLQKNSVFLSKNTFLYPNFTLKQNLQIISLLYKGFDLSNATIHSFMFQDIENELVGKLTEQQKQLLILSYVVCCPSLLWIIDKELVKNLTDEQKFIIDNAIKIRIKHGGVILFV